METRRCDRSSFFSFRGRLVLGLLAGCVLGPASSPNAAAATRVVSPSSRPMIVDWERRVDCEESYEEVGPNCWCPVDRGQRPWFERMGVIVPYPEACPDHCSRWPRSFRHCR